MRRQSNPLAMPVTVGVALASGALQVLAEDSGVEILHVKGPGVDDALLASDEIADPVTGATQVVTTPRSSVDVDLLVRPSHVGRLFDALRAHGWAMAYRFEDGSAFEHASTWLREGLAAADLHRTFPGFGIDPEAAFERLWTDRHTVNIAGYPCTVPSVTAQRLILILHAARGGDLDGGDIARAWGRATADERAAVDALAAELGATVALAAGTGRLEQHRGAREYPLWRALSSGDHSRLALWTARVRAQPTLRAQIGTAVKLARPKPGRLRYRLGRQPTPLEVGQAWGLEVATVVREIGARLVRRRGASR